MSSDTVAFRFPHRTEFRMTAIRPRVGDIFAHNGREFVVLDVSEDLEGSVVATLGFSNDGIAGDGADELR
jgi:ribosomal protein S19